MFQRVKRYFAIRSYVERLSRELVRRFDRRPFYSIEQVLQAAQRGGFSMTFIAHAHAVFCREEDFDAFYRPDGAGCNYQNLRRTIARRYFSGSMEFNAETIILKFRRGNFSHTEFSESGIGDNPGGGTI